MKLLRTLYRSLLLLVHISLGIALTLRHSHRIRHGIPDDPFREIKQRWMQRVCRIVGLEISIHGSIAHDAYLLASNHISWLDIPLLGGLIPATFLAKSEISRWPVVGWLASKTGTLFIERGGPGAAKRANDEISHHLQGGHPVIIFPEGTTTDGTTVRRFHPRLFAVAIDGAFTVQPIAIRYRTQAGELSQKVPFIDHMLFTTSLWRILGEAKHYAEVHFLPVLDKNGDKMRRHLAETAHTCIADILSDTTSAASQVTIKPLIGNNHPESETL
jgi:1-acyl-sn-glycerol-3-phosphate acyltransferase